MDNQVCVYLARIPQYQDRIRRYKIILDDAEVGKIAQDETFKVQVCPGDHRIKLKIDWTSSNTLVFNARLGEDVRLECGNNLGLSGGKWVAGLRALAALTVVRNSYLYVKRAG